MIDGPSGDAGCASVPAVGALSTAIAPYPTEGEVWKKLGDAHQRSRLGPRLAAFLRRYFGWVR